LYGRHVTSDAGSGVFASDVGVQCVQTGGGDVAGCVWDDREGVCGEWRGGFGVGESERVVAEE